MIGSAITALVFVSFLIFGVVVTNQRDVRRPPPVREGISEDFFVDLKAIMATRLASGDLQELEKLNESEVEISRKAPGSYFKALERAQQASAQPSPIEMIKQAAPAPIQPQAEPVPPALFIPEPTPEPAPAPLPPPEDLGIDELEATLDALFDDLGDFDDDFDF